MTLLAERSTLQRSDAEIANDLTMTFFEGKLNQAEYDKAIQELINRQFSAEALGTLILFGESEWQRKYR
jgi:hypothetical protein